MTANGRRNREAVMIGIRPGIAVFSWRGGRKPANRAADLMPKRNDAGHSIHVRRRCTLSFSSNLRNLWLFLPQETPPQSRHLVLAHEREYGKGSEQY